ncbi:MAG: DUF1189 family protein [Rickettsiaceae bacterium]
MTTFLSAVTEFIKTLISHLWLSVSSVKFYQDVFWYYKGNGTKYIFTLSVASSIMCTIFFLNQANQINDYLNKDVISSGVSSIDRVINQLPVFEYDGSSVSVREPEPIFINNIANSRVLAIDTANKLSHSERNKIPVLLLKDQVNINLFDAAEKVKSTVPIKYVQIFGPVPQTLTKENIKSSFASVFEKAPRIITYFIFPMMVMVVFINTLLEKVLMILMIFFFVKIKGLNRSLQDCIRVVLFSSGLYTLFQLIFFVLLQEMSFVLGMLQIWANFLMIFAIISSRDKGPILY